MLRENNYIKNDKTNWSNKTMLFVDDDYASFLLVQELLHETKIQIIEAFTGYEALSVFQAAENINIVLLDIKLPGIDGFEVCKQMKKINHTIPVVAQTNILQATKCDV
jgi:CheY-like chemotaxis protein